MTRSKPDKGTLLIAEPSLTGDISFTRSVVLLAEHSEEGSLGFILNKPLHYMISDLVKEIEIPFPVYNGGPVEQDNLYFIHKVPHLVNCSVEIADGIYWGGNFETIITLINNGDISENDIRFFLGYSGWDALQLDQELESQSWVLVENNMENDIFLEPAKAFWNKKIHELGGRYLIWANAPENPSLN